MPTFKVESFTDAEFLAEGRSLLMIVWEKCGAVLRGLPEPEGTRGMSAGEVKADGRAFDRMPALAEALAAAGCTDEAVLGHCRQPVPHVRGCWVIDLILAKS